MSKPTLAVTIGFLPPCCHSILADDPASVHTIRGGVRQCAALMIGDAGEHVGEVVLRVETVELGAFDQRVDRGGAAAAGIRRGVIMPGIWEAK
jgi:hypothetical protein